MKVTDRRGQLFARSRRGFLAIRTHTRIFLALVVAACGGDGGSSDTPPDSALVCTHLQDLRTVTGSVETFGSINGARFDGTVCIDGRADLECAVPGPSRRFELCAPSATGFGLRFTKAGFEKTVYLHGPGATQAAPFTVGDDAFVAENLWIPAGGVYPPATQGHLVVVVFEESGGAIRGLANAEIAILPSAGLDVVYLGPTGAPDPNRMTTAASGVGLVANVPPGMYDLQINVPTHPNCAYLTGGFASPDLTQDARIPVVAATTTVASIQCTP
jgi:hypothetical protein